MGLLEGIPGELLKPFLPTTRNQIQENTISVYFVPGMRFLVFDFRVYSVSSLVLT